MLLHRVEEVPVVKIIPCAGYHVGIFAMRSVDKNTPSEDSVLVDIFQDNGLLLAVADGVGSSPNSAQASHGVLHDIKKAFSAAKKTLTEGECRNLILDSLEFTNQRLLAESMPSAQTTLTMCLIIDHDYRVFQIGDSGLLHYGQRGKLKYKTVAHSPVGYALEAGLIDEHTALAHPENHYVDNVVGDKHMKVEICPQIPLGRYDNLLLASDGLLDNATFEELSSVSRQGPFEQAFQKLADACITMKNPISNQPFPKYDDISFILCRRSR